MKITFSYNQTAQIKLNAERYSTIYWAVRSYLYAPVGVLFTSADLLDALNGDKFTRFADDAGIEVISIRGVQYDLDIAFHAIAVERAFIAIGNYLQLLSIGGCTIGQLAKVVREYKTLIDATEW